MSFAKFEKLSGFNSSAIFFFPLDSTYTVRPFDIETLLIFNFILFFRLRNLISLLSDFLLRQF